MEFTLPRAGDINTKIGDILKAINNLIPTQDTQKNSVSLLSQDLEEMYERYGDTPEFRDAFETMLIKLMEAKGVEAVYTLFSSLPIKRDIKNQIIGNIKEAEKTLSLKKKLKENSKLEEILRNL